MSSRRDRDPAAAADADAAIARALRGPDASSCTAQVWNRFAGRAEVWLLRRGCPKDVLDEALQNVFERIIAQGAQLDNDNVGAWIYTLCRYEALTRAGTSARERRQAELARAGWSLPTVALADEIVDAARLARVMDEFRDHLSDETAFLFDTLGDAVAGDEVAAAFTARFGEPMSARALCDRRLRLRSRARSTLLRRGFQP